MAANRNINAQILNLILVLSLSFLFSVSCKEKTNPSATVPDVIYNNPSFSVEERTEDLLSRMTIEEKIGQMTQAERQALQSEADIQTYFLGSILSGGGSSPSPNRASEWADMYDRFQSQAVKTRLGIPIIYGIDAVHGHNNVHGATIFPHNIGMGCTGNPNLVEQAARATAKEVAGTGIDWTFAPCIAVPQDERWGRTYEGFGETPELAEQMAAAMVRGFQGADLADPSSILACAKHFVGDGGTTNGDDQGNTQVDEQTLRNIHLPGYIAAINAGIGSIMVSFSSWNGQKMHGHKYLLSTVLKGELGFEGFLISDWSGIDQLPGDYASDIETSINAGLDMIMVPTRYQEFVNTLKSLVDQNRVSMDRIDDAVRRILKVKFNLGLFESPFTDRSFSGSVGSAEHRQIARECVRQSLVLLQNDNQILPLTKNLNRIHISGKNANDLGNQCGGWTIRWQGGSGNITVGTTVLQAIVKAAASGTNVTFSSNGSGASGADVGIAVIGETPYAEGNGDRNDLNLSASDIQTVLNLHNANIPVVTILISGRPMIIEPILSFSDAIVAAWLPGTEGDGIADVIFGDYNPTGRLSHSWPRTMNQIPINWGGPGYNPLYPYGFGLSY